MTERLYSVYVHTTPNNKKYVGITSVDVEERWQKGNGYKNNIHFKRAIKKYGWDCISHEIIKDSLNEEEAVAIEQKLIQRFKSLDPKFGFNKTTGGEKGKCYSDESKLKMSKNRIGLHSGIQHHCYGKKPEDIFGIDGVKKQKQNAKIKWTGDNNPNRLNPKFGCEHHNYGRKWSEEVIEKMRLNNVNRKLSDDDARNILKLYFENQKTQKEIAIKYQVSRQTIGDIILRRSFKHLNYSYAYNQRYDDAKNNRIKKISKKVGKLDDSGNVIIKAESTKELAKITGWSTAGILKHLKNRVKHPVFVYL